MTPPFAAIGPAGDLRSAPPSSPVDPATQAYFLEHARTLAREHPEHLAALGQTAEQYAQEMAEPGLTIEESVAAGWMSAAEGRFIQGNATAEDLIALGHSSAEVEEILLDQRVRACASST